MKDYSFYWKEPDGKQTRQNILAMSDRDFYVQLADFRRDTKGELVPFTITCTETRPVADPVDTDYDRDAVDRAFQQGLNHDVQVFGTVLGT